MWASGIILIRLSTFCPSHRFITGLRGVCMKKKRDLPAISKVILETLRADFENIEIVDVMVDEDVDFDGDEILRIEVVFHGKPKGADAHKFSSAVRHIRPKLDDIGENAFPILWFISDHELKRQKLAAS